MGKINLYKINDIEELESALKKGYDLKSCKDVPPKEDKKKINYKMLLYYGKKGEDVNLQWNWILNAFGKNDIKTQSKPKAVVLIKIKKNNNKEGKLDYYTEGFAASYGQAYKLVDSYANKEWVFEVAKKLKYNQVRIMGVTMPNSRNNRRINTYYGNNILDWGSGEAITNLKARIDLTTFDSDFWVKNSSKENEENIPKNFKPPFDETIKMGNSISFTLKKEDLNCIGEIITLIFNILDSPKVQYDLPYLQKESNEKNLEELENDLNETFNKIMENPEEDYDLDISEYNVAGSRIDFIDENVTYTYEYKELSLKSKEHEKLDINDLIQFAKEIKEKNPKKEFNLLNIKIHIKDENDINSNLNIKKFIFYNDEKSNHLLIDGNWSKYDTNYLKYLENSIDKIESNYEPKFDIPTEDYMNFVKECKKKNKKSNENVNYFTEEYFNKFMHEIHNFELYDRKSKNWEKYQLEKMDLYDAKTDTFFAVKIGQTSSQLNYVFDQCLNGLIYLEHEEPEKYSKIKKVCIWIIYTAKRTPFVKNVNEEGIKIANLNDLNLLIVKNRLDEWKKQILLRGLKPIVWVNYKSKT